MYVVYTRALSSNGVIASSLTFVEGWTAANVVYFHPSRMDNYRSVEMRRVDASRRD